jgi:hypothetical protein
VDRLRRPRWSGLILGLGGFLGLVSLPLAWSGGLVAAHDLDDPLASLCGVQVRTGVAPLIVTPGMTVSLRDQLVFSCPQRRRPFHLALVAWRPDEAESLGAAWVPAAMARLAEDVGPEAQGWVALGAGAYAGRAVAQCVPTRDAAAVRSCVARLAQPMALGDDGRGLGDAVYQAWKGLRLARGDVRLRLAEDPLRESMIVVVPPDLPATAPGCQWARSALGWAVADGVDVRLVCATDDCAAQCVTESAAGGHLVPRPLWGDVARQMVAHARASELRVADVALHENLAAQLVPGSSDPPYDTYDAATGMLGWRLGVLRSQAFDVNFALWPQGRGTVPLAARGYLQFTDTMTRTGSAVLPARQATVGWSAVLPLAVRAELGVSP